MVLLRRRRRLSVPRRREARAGLLFVLPWLVGLLLFTAYPVLAAVYLSFTDYNILQPPRWVGLQNYTTMLTADPDFWLSVGNTGYYALLSVPLGLLSALLLALALNLRVRGIGVYRTLCYLPALVPPVASTIVFLVLLHVDNGLVDVLLHGIGLPAPDWLDDPIWSKPGLVLLSLWGVGPAALILLAGLQDIPRDLLDAAMVDGAGAWRRFRHITLPLLSPVILFNLVMGVIDSLRVFTQAVIVGGSTGNPVGSTLMIMVLIYRSAFEYFQMGYAAALAVALCLIVLGLTLTILGSARWWVYYEGERHGA